MKRSLLKKGLATLLGSTLLAASLGACAVPAATGTTTSAPAAETTAAEPAAETTDKGEPREIVMGFYINAEMPTDMDKVLDKLNEYLIEKVNAKIVDTVILNYGNYLDQINLILSGDEKLDLFLCRNSNNFLQYQSRGQLLPLDDLLAQYGSGIVDAVGADYLEADRIAGELYGITTIRDLAKVYGFVMPESLVTEYGIDLEGIKTMDDMAAAFNTAKEANPNITPWVSSVGANVMLEYLMGVDPLTDYAGVLLNKGLDEELKVVNYFETPEYEQWVKTMHEYYENGYIAKDFLTITDSPHDLLRAHTAFAMSTGLKPGFDVQESQVLKEPAVSVPLTDTYTTSTLVQTAQWCIPHNATEPDAAMQVLNLMYSDPYVYNLITWGIEGEHYVFTEDGHITYPEGIDATNSGYSLGLGWIFGNQYMSYVWEGDDLDVYDQLKEFNTSAEKSGAFGFTYDTTPVKTEVAAVSSVMSEYRAGLEFGVLDPETALPAFQQKLKEAGIDKIIEEKQRQLDEWLANK